MHCLVYIIFLEFQQNERNHWFYGKFIDEIFGENRRSRDYYCAFGLLNLSNGLGRQTVLDIGPYIIVATIIINIRLAY